MWQMVRKDLNGNRQRDVHNLCRSDGLAEAPVQGSRRDQIVHGVVDAASAFGDDVINVIKRQTIKIVAAQLLPDLPCLHATAWFQLYVLGNPPAAESHHPGSNSTHVWHQHMPAV